ncbi:hypothetical protein [Antarcticirhabdus aurantiaca]|uniref:Uncharacterized protein n=1 Tax=Antarcticirhabdus aurantiaca TaxID=2606717 RepID=A0ACD4NNK6_9HYPH|nr:hypothetical protein [Antarcticirhabdus aurantiaca]WAJ28246.1 hypothetical protein OXU80_26075 [Jeongeuplla avenae]
MKRLIAIAVAAVLILGLGYLWWSRAPDEPVDEAQKLATGCQDAIEEWRRIRADSENARSRVAHDALEAAERCQYEASPDDVDFADP